MSKKKQTWYEFTPGLPICRNSKGQDVQLVDGKEQPLYPPDVAEINHWRKEGMPDEDIREWLNMV